MAHPVPPVGAAVPGGGGAVPPPPPLPYPLVPTPTAPVSFRTHVFNDPQKDPELGSCHNLLNPFIIDIANPGNNIAVATLRNQIAAKGAALDPLALAILSDGKAKVYLCPQRLDQPLGQPPHNRYDTFYAFDGDLLDNIAYHAIIPNGSYDLIVNTVLVADVPTTLAAIGGDPNLTMMGPHNPGDANTEVVRVRRIVPVPFMYVPIFLANEVTPRFYFETIYPQVAADNRAAECVALHRFFQVAITASALGAPSVLDQPPLAPAPRDVIIHNMRKRVLHFHLPTLNQNSAQLAQNAIAAQLGVLAAQQQQYRQEDTHRRQAASTTVVEKWLGTQRFQLLLKLSGVATEANLNPFWTRVATSRKSEQVAILQATFDHYRNQLNEPHLTFAADASLLQTTVSMVWSMTTLDSIGTGIQFFRFGDTDLEAAQLRQAELELMLSGTANASLTDAREALDVKITLPPPDGSTRNVRRMQIWALAVLPPNHPIHVFLEEHYNDMESFRPTWNTWKPALFPNLMKAKGVFHLKYMSTEISEYWKEQSRTHTPVDLPKSNAISSAITRERHWEPHLSSFFIQKYKLYEFCGTIDPARYQLPGLNQTPVGHGSGGPATPTAPNTGTRVSNGNFNTALFLNYKESSVRSQVIRNKIRDGELPQLPPSKVDGSPMCLAYHTKGVCNTNCTRQADHVSYTSSEYQPLSTWCSTNYPSSNA